MESLVRSQPGRNFRVAVEATERGPRTKLMASGTVGCAVKGLVRQRKLTGRDLRPGRREKRQQEEREQALEQEFCKSRRLGIAAIPLNNFLRRLRKTR